MKRFLLFAVATLMVGAVSAQSLAKRELKPQTKSSVLKNFQHEIELANAPVAKSASGISKKRAMALNKKFFTSDVKVKNVNAMRNKRAGSKRAAEVQETYTGTGKVTGNGTSPWVMASGTAEEGSILLLADIIPNPYADQLDYIAAEYTVANGVVTIAPQYVFGTDSWNAFIFGGTTEDGSIQMTLGEDGSLTLPAGEQIYYGAFSGEEYDPSLEKYLGYIEYVSNITYALPGQIIAPVVEYNPTGLYLHFNISSSAYSYSNGLAMVPAYSPLTLVNGTTDLADRWEWSMEELDNELEPISSQTGNDRDFTVQTTNGNYAAAKLIGYNQDAASEPFVLGAAGETENAYLFAGSIQYWWDFSDGTYPMVTLANPDNEISRYTSFATPDQNNTRSIATFVFYQGKPETPLYLEGINMFVGNMTIKDADNFNLKCKIQKVTRDGGGWPLLGEVIAQADLTADKVQVGYTGSNNVAVTELIWDELYVEDEFGMAESISFLNLEEEFAIVIDGWDNGTFSCDYIWGEYDSNVSAPYFTYYFKTGDEQIDDNIYRSPYNCCQLVGFVGGGYGYLHTTDDTNITVPEDGTPVSIHVEPFFSGENDETGETETALWLADDSDDVPSWLDVLVTDPVSEDDISFDIIFSLAAEGSRAASSNRASENSCHLVFEQWGSKLAVDVSRSATGISVVTNKVETAAPAYNLAGQRVNKNFKGLVVKDGRKVVVK